MLVTNIECFFNIMPRPALGGLSEFTLSASSRQNTPKAPAQNSRFPWRKKEESVVTVFVRAPLERQLKRGLNGWQEIASRTFYRRFSLLAALMPAAAVSFSHI